MNSLKRPFPVQPAHDHLALPLSFGRSGLQAKSRSMLGLAYLTLSSSSSRWFGASESSSPVLYFQRAHFSNQPFPPSNFRVVRKGHFRKETLEPRERF